MYNNAVGGQYVDPAPIQRKGPTKCIEIINSCVIQYYLGKCGTA